MFFTGIMRISAIIHLKGDTRINEINSIKNEKFRM